MGASGGFPIDLVLFGMIAAFLVLRLRSILGRREGFERPPEAPVPEPVPGRPMPRAVDGPVIDVAAEPAAARPLPDPAGPLGQVLGRMVQVDRSFEPGRFLSGAETAFRMIVLAFASGNRDTL